VDLEDSLRIQRRGLADFVRLLGRSSPGAAVFERDDVLGAVVPTCPERSMVNSVVYGRPVGLAGALAGLEDAYRAAGISAWIVWVPEPDREGIAVLRDAGYRLDSAPAAMQLELADLPVGDPGALDWDAEATAAEVGTVNDRAYGLPAKVGLSPALATPPPDLALRLYRARVGGEVACVVGAMDHGDDLGIYFVATLREHRGRGLTSRLMAVALAEGRERGLATSSLQASRLGQPVYERLGYSTAFRFQLWERRPAR
jgi:ribosomal protein S18 acetylase RimI-like enzyme